ncbi:LysR family transcriptional regulator [Rhodobacteraceae bacterium RKSG542]|uniref:LysR family transcriptional regulator n=1 Tax=Pseudovibrio flavus TaxID=2529854 RepID=UPI0012BB577F|nr:LysR family transcriptional regulator [Pseudovibrio flavus]MTI16998.1 LysR family transcriptional regulator [Pseudovibrio flavus]
MNWDDTRIFLAVARSGQFLAAAQRLGINHATVARRITALETSIASKLLDRRTTGCVLTEDGERFLEFAERMEAEMLNARTAIGGSSVELSGSVRIGAPDGFGVHFLAPKLVKLSDRFPALTLQLVPLHRSFSLSRREADIAITVGRPEQGRLISRSLVTYRLALYASRSYLERAGVPQSLEDLAQHRLVGYVEDLVYTPALNYSEEVMKGWHSSLECSSALAQTEAVRAGGGIGVLHSYIAAKDPDLVQILPETFLTRTYWLVYHESVKGLRRIRETCDFITEEVKRASSEF